MFKNTLIIAGIAAGLALTVQPAAAQSAAAQSSGTEAMQRLVRYSDLDLSSAQGQAKLDARLRSAASAVCAANYGPHPLSEAMEARRCYRNALNAAQRQVASIGNTRLVSR